MCERITRAAADNVIQASCPLSQQRADTLFSGWHRNTLERMTGFEPA